MSSILDQLEETHVDVSKINPDVATVCDYYQWHLTIALPVSFGYKEYESILEREGSYITEILSSSRAVVDCNVTAIKLNTFKRISSVYEYVDDKVLTSGVLLSAYEPGDMIGPYICVGMGISRNVNLRCLMRLLYLIAFVQNKNADILEYHHNTKIRYDGEALMMKEINEHCIKNWLDREFTESDHNALETTAFALEAFGYEKFHNKPFDEQYYQLCAFKVQNFEDLTVVRKRKGQYTLPMTISFGKEKFNYEIYGNDFDITYFKYYIIATIVDRLKGQMDQLKTDQRYAYWMRLLGDYKYNCQGRRPEQIISYQRVFDISQYAYEKLPVKCASDIEKIVTWVNETVKSAV